MKYFISSSVESFILRLSTYEASHAQITHAFAYSAKFTLVTTGPEQL